MDKWARRQRKLLELSIDELNTLLQEAYSAAYNEVYTDLIDTYNKILDKNGKPLISHLYQFDRYYKVAQKLEKRIDKLGGKEEKAITEALTKMYEENSSLLGEEFGLSTDIDEDEVRRLVKSDWLGDGENLSDRIWKDKAALVRDLKKMLVDSVVTGRSINKYAAELQKRFEDVEFWKCKRLVRTEMVHMQMQSTLDRYEDAGYTKYQILTVGDDKVCEECEGMNGKEFNIKDADWGVNIPPFHPNCRCTIIAVK